MIIRMFSASCDNCTETSAGFWYKSELIKDLQADGWLSAVVNGEHVDYCSDCVSDHTFLQLKKATQENRHLANSY